MYGNKSVTCEKFLFLTTIFLTYAVVESHPDSTHPDLRLDRPFPGLVQYVDALDLNTMTKKVNIVYVDTVLENGIHTGLWIRKSRCNPWPGDLLA